MKDDAISRQQAIGEADRWLYDGNDKRTIGEMLRDLPSAQPEIIHCRDCKHHHYESKGIPYCDRIDYGYGWKDDDFCSRAERRTE